jgi:hypothetical protein
MAVACFDLDQSVRRAPENDPSGSIDESMVSVSQTIYPSGSVTT